MRYRADNRVWERCGEEHGSESYSSEELQVDELWLVLSDSLENPDDSLSYSLDSSSGLKGVTALSKASPSDSELEDAVHADWLLDDSLEDEECKTGGSEASLEQLLLSSLSSAS